MPLMSSTTIFQVFYSPDIPRWCFDRRFDDGLSMLSRRFELRKMFRFEGTFDVDCDWLDWLETELRALPGADVGNSFHTASTIESMLDERGIGLQPLSRLFGR